MTCNVFGRLSPVQIQSIVIFRHTYTRTHIFNRVGDENFVKDSLSIKLYQSAYRFRDIQN